MRTTVDIPERLLRKARARAALDGVKMIDVVNEALARFLGESDGLDPAAEGLPKGVQSRQLGRFQLPVLRGGRSRRARLKTPGLKSADSTEDEERHAKIFGR